MEYKEPHDRLAKNGYASSIMNGTTVEGGLRSITYKSIYALKLVEELSSAREAVLPTKEDSFSLTDKNLESRRVLSLKLELEALEALKLIRNTSTDQVVDQFNLQLDNELLSTKSISEEYQKALLEKCGCFASDNTVTFKRFISKEPVATMEEVEGFDGTMYHQAAERRREEERIENEKFALEAQKLEEEAMMEELEMRQQDVRPVVDIMNQHIPTHNKMHVDPPAMGYNNQHVPAHTNMQVVPPFIPPGPPDMSFNLENNLGTSSYAGSYSTTPGI